MSFDHLYINFLEIKAYQTELVIIGSAERDGATINFVLNLEQELNYYCGEYIGDERQSLVELGHAGEGHCFEANSGQTS